MTTRTTAGMMITNPNTLGLFESTSPRSPSWCTPGGGLRLLRRRQPERAARHGPPGRHGRRRHALQPAQDLLHAPRRRRARLRAGRGQRRLAPFLPVPVVRSEGAAASACSTTTGRRASAGCRPSTATSACSCGPTPTSAAWAAAGLRRRRDGGAQRQLPAGAARRDATTCRTTGRACTRSSSPTATSSRRPGHDAGHRQAADRLRLPPADHLLPADRQGGADDRADRDREPARRSTSSSTPCWRSPGRRGRARAAAGAPVRTRLRRLDETAAARQPRLRWTPPVPE